MSALDDICQKAKITDYLETKGYELIYSGRRIKCSCPLPGHDERTPSFFIGEFDDGAQYFKCYGCSSSGNIITLIRLMEGKKDNGTVFKELAKTYEVETQGFDYTSIRLEPMPEDVLAHFCSLEYPSMNIASYGRAFLECMGGTEDSVNKVSRLYKKLDEMLEIGDDDGIEQIYEQMGDLLIDLGGRKWEKKKKKHQYQ